MAGMAIPLRNLAHQINDVPLLDVMDALGTPVRDEVPPQAVRQCSRCTNLWEAFPNKRLDQILDLIDYQPTPGLMPLFSWVPAIQPGGEDLLRLGTRHRQGDASVGTDGIFAQSWAGAAKPIHYDEDLAAPRRHLDAKARQSLIPVHCIPFGDGKSVNRRLGHMNARNGVVPYFPCYLEFT
jgi:hypothetical protein